MTVDEVVAIDFVDRIKDWIGGKVCDAVDGFSRENGVECHKDVNSNKRGCGSPAQTQAPACFLCGPRSPTRVQVFVANAWICACQATDRDLGTKK